MKIKFISDTHNKHHLIPKDLLENDGTIDTIIHAGDISSRGTEDEVKSFLNWYDTLPFKNKIFIPGNHDWFFERASKFIVENLMSKYPNITLLNSSGIEIDGIKFWGTPSTPYFHGWAFNYVGDTIKEVWNKIPLDTNILITHGPIFGYLDMTIEGDRTGCEYLREILPILTELKVHVCGHIHESYGYHEFVDGQLFLNASVLNRRYEIQNKPIVLDLNDFSTLELGRVNK